MWWTLQGCAHEAATPPSGFDSELAAELQAALDGARTSEGSPGAALTVVVPAVGTWSGASGLADVPNDQAVRPDDRFGIGSITKTFVATVILELDAEGALSIDDAAATYIPDAPYADQFTVRQLLAHTSGLSDFVNEPDILAGGDRVWTPEELLAFVAARPLEFTPGSGWDYSNAGYVELALVIESVTGEDYGAVLHERLLDPLGLDDTFVPSWDGVQDMARGYFGNEGEPSDVTDFFDPTSSWGCGEMVSSAPDLARWADALYGGDVLDANHLEAMTTPGVLPDGQVLPNGLGCFVEDSDGERYLGHNGWTMGFGAQLTYRSSDAVTTASLFNDFVADVTALDDAAWDVVR